MRYSIHFILLILISVSSTLSAQITGYVVDEQNIAIENVLVSHTDDAYIYTKTDSEGAFSIEGNSGTELTVAALFYETTKIAVSETSNITITLLPDALLEDDVFHISFDPFDSGRPPIRNFRSDIPPYFDDTNNFPIFIF